ncbi:MAG: DUF2914 domain-containing protein [Candidatus Dechloromonas phosphoritropha]|nr:DUF2914 domain-containing protein [Candidatus Dechloromonas phosphoritropha]MBP8786929.1 DUF2914 domain-containing protein [Azonexus sp.]MBP9227434.1 DUF2914 domain-containing protein [Azonexus sp.]
MTDVCRSILVDNQISHFSSTQHQARIMIKNKLFVLPALALAISLPMTGACAADGSVNNATFTSGISDGAPIDYRQGFLSNTPVVYFYSELLDLKGQTVRHRWSLEGKVMQEVPIEVTRPRQAAWSKSEMQPDWTGDWTVEVVDKDGKVLNRSNFAYNPN